MAPTGSTCALKNLHRSLLKPELQRLYDHFFSGYSVGDESVSVRSPCISNEDACELVQAIWYDYADALGITQVELYYGSDRLVFKPQYNVQISELRGMERVYRNNIRRIVSICLDNCSTDYEKELFIHDHLANTVTYLKDSDDGTKFTAYGALVEDKAVCMGIARAFSVILNEAGIDCGCITNKDHMWNIVKINGRTYHLDATWDLRTAQTSHDYFNLPDKWIIRDHECTYGPRCVDSDANWYVVNDLVFTDAESLYNALSEKLEKREVSLHFKYSGLPDEDVQGVIDKSVKDSAPCRLSYSTSLNHNQNTGHIFIRYS